MQISYLKVLGTCTNTSHLHNVISLLPFPTALTNWKWNFGMQFLVVVRILPFFLLKGNRYLLFKGGSARVMSWCIAVKSCRCRKNAHVWVKLNFCLFSTREWFSTSSGYCDHPVGCQKSLFSEVCWWTSYKKNWQGLVAEHSDLKSMFLSKLLKLLRAKQLNLQK